MRQTRLPRRRLAQNLDSSALRLYLYNAAALQQNSAGMQMQLTWASGEPGVEDDFLNNQANNLASSGQVARARELTRRATEAARRADEKETAAGYETGRSAARGRIWKRHRSPAER